VLHRQGQLEQKDAWQVEHFLRTVSEAGVWHPLQDRMGGVARCMVGAGGSVDKALMVFSVKGLLLV
jgi:hypothetical protein